MRGPLRIESTKTLMNAWHVVLWVFIVGATAWLAFALKTNAPRAFSHVSAPFTAAREWVSAIGSVSDDIVTMHVLHGELADAQLTIDELETERAMLRTENEFLKSQVGVRTRVSAIPYVGHISIRGALSLARFVSIDLGFHQGVKESMNVIASGRVLVGRVSVVRENSSQVVLLSDPLSRVSARTETAQGVVIGQLNSELIFDLVLKDHAMTEGEMVYTSGIDGIFIPGLPIGRIIRVVNNQSDVYQRAFIKPSADYDRLSEVLVIQGFQ